MGVISVKAGKNLNPAMIRELRGTVERENAEMGVFICLGEPTFQMEREASTAGFFESSQGRHPRIQIRTIDALLSGKGIDCPLLYTTVTMAEAGRRAEKQSQKRQTAPSAEILRQRNLLLPIIGQGDRGRVRMNSDPLAHVIRKSAMG
ncbi:hypothetical protein AU467_22040 [Mesorhizobium loti]|uniref:Uncharacterized protein n=1 Tax=Rhizobium loti TaxID=381 RepID=A0A101KSX4_RHILI|nr:hypothetical protein AU467_22040 [Mesorhizobium loti]